VNYDFNILEDVANNLMKSGNIDDAIKIYIFMSDGDQSLDGGYLGKKLGQCYELLGRLHEAKYWYGRAIEENPEVRIDCIEARARLENVGIDEILAGQRNTDN
jgi:tetratricopeptide (TPR) repeat protein